MKVSQLMFVGGILWAGLLTLASAGAIEATDKTLDGYLAKKIPTILDLYAPWCGHCKRLAPVFDELGELFGHAQDKIQIIKLDGDSNRKTAKRFNIEYFPTLKYIDANGNEEDFEKRELEDMIEFIESKTGAKAKRPKQPPSYVVQLNDQNFKQQVEKDNGPSLVAFTASWCGHCKNLKPDFEELAKIYSRDPVTIGQVDVTAGGAEELSEKYSIQSFPTILYFPSGSDEPVPYPSGRSVDAFINYINDEAKLYRTHDGGLNEDAGLIASFNELAKKVTTSGNSEKDGDISKMKTMVNKLDATLKQYGDVYVRVAQKIAEKGVDYVNKEIKRVEGILTKKSSGISQEKLDQMKVRLNILGQFKPESSSDQPKDEL